MVQAIVSVALAWQAAAGVVGPPPNPCTAVACTPVFYPGLNGSQCFRIPSIIATHTGTLLAFAENRIKGCGDQGTHDLVVRRSSDGGETWGALITAFVGVTPCPGCPAAVSNPNPVEVTFANGSKAVLLAFDTMNNPGPTHHGLDMTLWSHDDGLTWGAATVLSFPPEDNIGSLIGPAVGLQADDADGTLVFWITDGFLIVSKDHGATFTASQHVQGEPPSECSIAFASGAGNATLIMNCRSGQGSRRAQLYWQLLANGSYASTEPTYPTEFTDPGCQGSIVNTDNGTLFTSNAGSTTTRARLTIHRSTDAGQSWSAGQVLHAGPSAYSQLVQLPSGGMAVLFEAGVHGAYETISFAAFNFTPPVPPPPRPSQQWVHRRDGTLSTDGGKTCLDWTARAGADTAVMSPCAPAAEPHQVWHLEMKHTLTSGGKDAAGLALDWTSRAGADGGHPVYMHPASPNLPHQRWLFDHSEGTLSSSGLCLDSAGHDGDAEMRPCAGQGVPEQ